jgi:hypothetical protein
MNIPYYLLRSIGNISDRIQSKYKDVDTSIFHSGLIRMLVSEELGKKNISWEHFVIDSQFKLNITTTPQPHKAIPLASTSAAKVSTSKKRKGRVHVQVSEVIKEVTGTEEEACHSSQRYFSPPSPLELEEVPYNTKNIEEKGKKIHFASSPPEASTNVRKRFTRSTTSKEFV